MHEVNSVLNRAENFSNVLDECPIAPTRITELVLIWIKNEWRRRWIQFHWSNHSKWEAAWLVEHHQAQQDQLPQVLNPDLPYSYNCLAGTLAEFYNVISLSFWSQRRLKIAVKELSESVNSKEAYAEEVRGRLHSISLGSNVSLVFKPQRRTLSACWRLSLTRQ